MLVDRSALRELARATLIEKPLTFRRARYLAGFGSFFFAMRGLVTVARGVDNALFPGWREAPVRQPFFVFGNPRSGTTLLQYLMSLDEERFTHFKLWETMLPTVSAHRLVGALGRVDAALGRPMNRVIDSINERMFGRWEGVHNMGLRRPEEDEAVFTFTGNSTGLILMFPEVPDLVHVNSADELDPSHRGRLMDYYESALRRHVYAVGGNRIVLNKNVFTAGRVRTLHEKFPDARFVYVIRHPYDAIPSCINLFYVPWSAHSPEIPMQSLHTRRVAEWAVDWYRRALSFRDVVPASQMLVVRFEDMMKDPAAMVGRIYEHFALGMTPTYRSSLARAAQHRHTEEFKSAQRYTLDDWGIERSWVHQQLRDMFEEFSYDP